MPLTREQAAAHLRDWVKRVQSCENEANHTYGPPGYLAWHAWAAEHRKTHKQSRCPGCRLFLIWTPEGEQKP